MPVLHGADSNFATGNIAGIAYIIYKVKLFRAWLWHYKEQVERIEVKNIPTLFISRMLTLYRTTIPVI